MNENEILKVIFKNDVLFTNNSIIVNINYGKVIISKCENLKEITMDQISFELENKEMEENVRNKLCEIVKKLQGKYMIYSIIYYIIAIIEDRITSERKEFLEEVNEITEEMFQKWLKSRKSEESEEENVMTGKKYFLDLKGNEKIEE